jgi:hypothetical protein
MSTSQTGASPGPRGESALIASLIGADMNSAHTDQAMVLDAFVSGRYFIVDYFIFTNPSINLTTATCGVFTATGGTGQTLFASRALSGLTAAHLYLQAGPEAAATATGAISATATAIDTAPLVYVGTAQGAAATCDVYAYGRLLPS